VAEGEIVAWHVKAGDVVKEDQPMVEVMTDKATVTIGAPKKGTILSTHATAGQILPVGSLLVAIETSDAVAAAPAPAPVAATKPAPSAAPKPAAPVAPSKPSSGEGPAATAVGDIKDTLPGAAFFGGGAPTSAGASVAAPKANGAASSASDDGHYDERPLATPATRKLARDLGVDLTRVKPTGPNGKRVSRDDVLAHQQRAASAAVNARATARLRSRAPPSAATRIARRAAPRSRQRGSPRGHHRDRPRQGRRGARGAQVPSWACVARSPTACQLSEAHLGALHLRRGVRRGPSSRTSARA
jgi:pyruvate dehydrogenase E2 component (dihydrolipoamide acetyltransferase)